MKAWEIDVNTGKKKSLMSCPFCNGEFAMISPQVTLFDCGFCKNRLFLKRLVPAMSWSNLFSPQAVHIFHIYMTKPEALTVKKVVPYNEVWKENRHNLVIVSEMAFLGTLYAFLAIYMEQHGSTNIIFTNPFFSSIPLAIAVWYYLAYQRQNIKFLVNPIPVIKPDFDDR